MAIEIDEAVLISTAMEAILYGVAFLMFSATAWLLLRKGDHRRNYSLLVVGAVLILLATIEMVNNIFRMVKGFMKPVSRSERVVWFDLVAEPTFVIKSTLYGVQTLIFDAILIYRTWIVWQRRWLIVIPSLIGWAALLVVTVGIAATLITATAGNHDIFGHSTGRWITANYAITLSTNLLATSLLAYRIWQIDQQVSSFRENPLRPILKVILESGAIYSFTIIAALITFATQSHGIYLILDSISPIISIVFNMVIIRVKQLSLASERGIGPQGTGLLGPSYQVSTKINGDSGPGPIIPLSHQPSSQNKLTLQMGMRAGVVEDASMFRSMTDRGGISGTTMDDDISMPTPSTAVASPTLYNSVYV